jgi:hypothetical protein
MLAAPFLLFAAVTLPARLARLAGAVVFAIVVGLTWRAAMIGSLDLMLLMGGATLARRFGFPKPVSIVHARRIAVAFVAFISLEFGAFALLIANLTGDAVDALPFDLGFLLSGLALAVLLSRGKLQLFTRGGLGSMVWPSAHASLTCA